jgi:hypothetical protein
VSIDGCGRSFKEIVNEALPAYMQALRRSMINPLPLRDFNIKGVGTVTIFRGFGYDHDPRGCYVLIESGKPIYVGISKHIIERLIEHVRGTDHYSATLAYRMAKHKLPPGMIAIDAMANKEFHTEFLNNREIMLDWEVAFVEIDNPLELYLFEPYCAMELDTGLNAGGWNTFETH